MKIGDKVTWKNPVSHEEATERYGVIEGPYTSADGSRPRVRAMFLGTVDAPCTLSVLPIGIYLVEELEVIED